MTQFKAVEIFNALLSTEVSTKRYTKDKDLKEKDFAVVNEFVHEFGERINDSSVFNTAEFLKHLSKCGTKLIVDRLVDVVVGSLVEAGLNNMDFDRVLGDRSDAAIVKATFESEFRTVVEDSILNKGYRNDTDERERDTAMLENVYSIINENMEFYKFTPQQLLLAELDNDLLNELSPKEIISYMVVNCYITYDEQVAS